MRRRSLMSDGCGTPLPPPRVPVQQHGPPPLRQQGLLPHLTALRRARHQRLLACGFCHAVLCQPVGWRWQGVGLSGCHQARCLEMTQPLAASEHATWCPGICTCTVRHCDLRPIVAWDEAGWAAHLPLGTRWRHRSGVPLLHLLLEVLLCMAADLHSIREKAICEWMAVYHACWNLAEYLMSNAAPR